jgi:hypothetical protein
MLEFTDQEKTLIREKIIRGTTMRDMFSEEFMNNVRLDIEIDSSEEARNIFNYYSESYSSEKAVEELVNLVSFLTALESNGLVNKFFQPATAFLDYDTTERIIIGNSESEKRSRFIPPIGSQEGVVLYLYDNLDKKFKATQKLKVLVQNDFISNEERQHQESVSQTKLSNIISFISLAVSTVAIVSAFTSSNDNVLELRMLEIEATGKTLRAIHAKDSIELVRLVSTTQKLKQMIDSLRITQKSRIEKKP